VTEIEKDRKRETEPERQGKGQGRLQGNRKSWERQRRETKSREEIGRHQAFGPVTLSTRSLPWCLSPGLSPYSVSHPVSPPSSCFSPSPLPPLLLSLSLSLSPSLLRGEMPSDPGQAQPETTKLGCVNTGGGVMGIRNNPPL